MAVENRNALPNGTILRHGGTEYRIERFLGSGGFGITYLVSGISKKSGNIISHPYAVKEHFISQDCERDSESHYVVCSKPAKDRVDEGKKDFISEANRLKNDIQHSHIVRVKDVFEANKTAYYVMEFLDGKSLRSYIRKNGACSEREAILLLLPIARAVGYLHEQRITHLDIKPDNIMIVENTDGKLCPILIDFGLSKHYDKKGNPTSSIRVQATSDGYSPMEQYLGITDFQPTADIYALAATIVYCLTGKDPKRAADIRPGEMRLLLEGKISETTLSALLKGLNPSKYERTASIRNFLSELCPNEDLTSWDKETDNNITYPIFFRRKKVSFFTRIKNIFEKRKIEVKNGDYNAIDSRYDLLPIPDISIVIEIKQPKELGFSKQVYLCKSVCNTVFTYYGTDQIDDEDFFGDFSGNIINVLKSTGLLSPNHWENEFVPPTSDPLMCKNVKITFNYKNGTTFVRENSGIYGSNRLLTAAESILKCESIAHFVFGRDDELIKKIIKENRVGEDSKKSTTTPISDNDEGKLLSSFLIGIYKGFTTEISLHDWVSLSNEEKATFIPRFVYFKLEDFGCVQGQTIGLSVTEQIVGDVAGVKTALADYKVSLNPSGISGYEQGDCHLPNPEETRLLEYYHERINLTLAEWGMRPFSEWFWTEKNGNFIPNNPQSLIDNTLSVGLRFVVNYWSTRMNFNCKSNEDLSYDGEPITTIKSSIKKIEIKYKQKYSTIYAKRLILTAEGNNEIYTLHPINDKSKPHGISLSTVVHKWTISNKDSYGQNAIPYDVVNCIIKNGLFTLDNWGPTESSLSTTDIKNYEVSITIDYHDGSQKYFKDCGAKLRTSELLLIAKDILNQDSIRNEVYKVELEEMGKHTKTVMSNQNIQLLDSYILAIKNGTLYAIYPKTWLSMSAREKLSYFVCCVCLCDQPNLRMRSISLLPLLNHSTKESYQNLIQNIENDIASKCTTLGKDIGAYKNHLSFVLSLPLKSQLDDLYKIMRHVNFTLEFWNADCMAYNLPYMEFDSDFKENIHFPERNNLDYIKLVFYTDLSGKFAVPYVKLD